LDKVINDPRDCKIDYSKLPLCSSDKPETSCFTKEQVATIKAIYEPLKVGQQSIYPGYAPGLEAEMGSWNSWISGTAPNLEVSLHYSLSTGVYKYFVFNDASWDYSTYDFKNYFNDTRFAASFLDATQGDYSEFKKHNGKMIIYHGWNDPALSPYSTIEHYEAAMQKDRFLNDYIRLFLLPGVLHCDRGTGCDNVDWLGIMQEWVENNKAPDRIISSKIVQGKTIATRPVHPYPQVTVYSGSGDASQEKNYVVKQ
jgi:feruloyl esterase